jgi:predicted flap endonuclease-1-like 5' DNA nuclease
MGNAGREGTGSLTIRSCSRQAGDGRQPARTPSQVNGLTLLVVIALAVGVFIAFRMGMLRGRRDALATLPLRNAVNNAVPPVAPVPVTLPTDLVAVAVVSIDDARVASEKARLVRSLVSESDALRRAATTAEAQRLQLAEFAAERRRLLRENANAQADTARYRELVVDLENNALPPLLDGPNTFDDLKLIVGIGPVLERMLQRLGISTYRQIARWSERDIDEIDGKLPEFPGRIRRDTWVTQARELHQSKYGEALPVR